MGPSKAHQERETTKTASLIVKIHLLTKLADCLRGLNLDFPLQNNLRIFFPSSGASFWPQIDRAVFSFLKNAFNIFTKVADLSLKMCFFWAAERGKRAWDFTRNKGNKGGVFLVFKIENNNVKDEDRRGKRMQGNGLQNGEIRLRKRKWKISRGWWAKVRRRMMREIKGEDSKGCGRRGYSDGIKKKRMGGRREMKDVPPVVTDQPRVHYTCRAITAAGHRPWNLERSVIPLLPVYRCIALR